MKISRHPILDFEPGQEVTFTFDGKPYRGWSNEPIASALIANGIYIFRHTHKRGEPRGIFCGIGQCSDCLVVVDGVPNVRACTTILREWMKVETQKGHGTLGEKL